MAEISETMTRTRKFVIVCGSLGLLIAVVLSVIASHAEVSPPVLPVLWPTAILGAGTNATPTLSIGSIVLIGLEYGGNFLLYGVVGYFISGWRKPDKGAERPN